MHLGQGDSESRYKNHRIACLGMSNFCVRMSWSVFSSVLPALLLGLRWGMDLTRNKTDSIKLIAQEQCEPGPCLLTHDS